MFWKITQWSRWVKQPKALNLGVLQSVSIFMSHIYTTRYLGSSLPCCFTTPELHTRGETEKKEGRVPSRVDSCDSSICGYKPGHYPIPENMENKRPIKHQSQSHWRIIEKVFVNGGTKLPTWHKLFYAHSHLSLYILMLNRYPAVHV